MPVEFGSMTSMLERQLLGREQQLKSTNDKVLKESSPLSSSQDSKSGASFVDALKGALNSANEIQKEADSAAKSFALGEGSLHETLIAMEKADISLRAVTAVRGKLVEAYQEIMKMPL